MNSPVLPAADAAPERTAQVLHVLEDYLARLERGAAPRPEELLAANPELAGPLREYLASLDFLHRAALSLRPGGPAVASPAAADLGPDQFGDFRIVRQVGRGGMGIVYEAEQVSLNRQVALKVLPFAMALDARQLQRFKNEAQAAACLHHSNIVPVYAVGSERGVHFYAMQFIDGRTLADLVGELRRPPGVPAAARSELADGLTSGRWAPKGSSAVPDLPTGPPAEPASATAAQPAAEQSTRPAPRGAGYFRTVAGLGVQAAEALEHAHQFGIVHRDVKPANLMLDGRGHLWITDFGLAQFQADAGLTLTGDLLGTLRYMSPEQARGGRGGVDHRTDVYSLGVTLYELLALRPAFGGNDRQEVLSRIALEEPPPPRRLDPGIPRDLETVVLKAMAKAADERYQTAQELADDLRRFLDDRPLRARRPTLWQRLARWLRRHKSVVRAVVVCALVGLILAVALLAVWNAQIAESNRLKDEALGREMQAKETAQEKEQEAVRALYTYGIALADREWWLNHVGTVEQLLDDCPREFRHWEWHYLKRRCHQDLLTLRGHTGIVATVAFSPDGKRIASYGSYGMRDEGVKVWDPTTGAELLSLPFPTRKAGSLTFSLDGQCLAAFGKDQVIRVWNATTGQVVLTLNPPGSSVANVVFSPDGKHLAAAVRPNMVQVWDSTTSQLMLSVNVPGKGVSHVEWSADGQQLLTLNADPTMTVWDATTGQEVHTIPCPGTGMFPVTVSSDGQFLARLFPAGDAVSIWSLATIKGERTFKAVARLSGQPGEFVSVAFSPDGKHLASVGTDQTVKIRDLKTGQELLTHRGHTAQVYGVAFSPDGKRLASASGDHTVKIWDATTNPDGFVRFGQAGEIRRDTFNLELMRLVKIGPDFTVKVWDLTADQEVLSIRGHQGFGLQVAITADGQRLATAGADQTVRIWDGKSGQELLTLSVQGHLDTLAFSPDGQRLVGPEGTVWETASGKELFHFQRGSTTRNNPAFSADSQFLAVNDDQGVVYLWNLVTGQELLTLTGWAGGFRSLALSPDHRFLAQAHADLKSPAEIQLWDTATGRELARLRGHTSVVNCMVFTPDGKHLVSASVDLRVWDVSTGEMLLLQGHADQVDDVAVSPDGKRLASASRDKTVKIWELATGRELLTLFGATSGVKRVVFSSDGRRLAALDSSHAVKIWDGTPWDDKAQAAPKKD